jgi:hypothetical protein
LKNINEIKKHKFYYFHESKCNQNNINTNCCKGRKCIILNKLLNKLLILPILNAEEKKILIKNVSGDENY